MSLVVLLAAVLVVAGVGAIATGSTPAAAASTTPTCNETVTHDAFRTADAISTINETGEATSTVQNTKVHLEDVTGFVRLHASNPNGYCVQYRVAISPEIVAAADLGQVESQNGNATASWRAAQNLSSGTVYTMVEFELEPGESVLFAPSQIRVQSLSWTGEAKRQSQGIVSSLTSLFGGEKKLEDSTYEIRPTNGSSRITVPLESPNGTRINSWHATYTLNGQIRTVTQEAEAPVYYTESDSAVTFHFSETAVEKNASVSFVAEPSPIQSIQHEARSYWNGWATIGELLPVTIGVGATRGVMA